MNAENFGAFFPADGIHNGADGFEHLFFRSAVKRGNERSDAVLRQNFGHFENRIGGKVVGSAAADAVDMRVNKARCDVGTLHVDKTDVGRKIFFGETGFVENINDFIAFEQDGTIVHYRIAGQQIGVMQADFRIH